MEYLGTGMSVGPATQSVADLYEQPGSPGGQTWSRYGVKTAQMLQGEAMSVIGGGETGAMFYRATIELHQLNGLPPQPNLTGWWIGDVDVQSGSRPVRLGSAQGFALFDGAADWLHTQEGQALQMEKLTYIYHELPGIGANTEKAKELFYQAQAGAQPVNGFDPYARGKVKTSNSPTPTPAEFVQNKGLGEAGAVVLIA